MNSEIDKEMSNWFQSVNYPSRSFSISKNILIQNIKKLLSAPLLMGHHLGRTFRCLGDSCLCFILLVFLRGRHFTQKSTHSWTREYSSIQSANIRRYQTNHFLSLSLCKFDTEWRQKICQRTHIPMVTTVLLKNCGTDEWVVEMQVAYFIRKSEFCTIEFFFDSWSSPTSYNKQAEHKTSLCFIGTCCCLCMHLRCI